LARTFASPCLGRKPKAMVMTHTYKKKNKFKIFNSKEVEKSRMGFEEVLPRMIKKSKK
jgi:hypothetical protein